MSLYKDKGPKNECNSLHVFMFSVFQARFVPCSVEVDTTSLTACQRLHQSGFTVASQYSVYSAVFYGVLQGNTDLQYSVEGL